MNMANRAPQIIQTDHEPVNVVAVKVRSKIADDRGCNRSSP